MIKQLKAFASSNFHAVSLYLLIAVSWLIVWPLGNFPLNDDWSYAKSIRDFLIDGTISPGTWPAMTLMTHLAWGFIFVKIFGFSFFVLRLSTLVSALIGIGVFYGLAKKWGGSKTTAFVASLALYFSPCFFNLSHTYMTDINFLVLLLIALKFADTFFQNHSPTAFAGIFITSLALVMLRQFGLIVPAGMIVACAFLKTKRAVYIGWSAGCLVLILFLLRQYENYLADILPPEANFEFTGTHNVASRQFWSMVWNNFMSLYKVACIEVLVYSFPVTIMFLPALFKEFKKPTILLLFAAVLFSVYYLFRDQPMQNGNIFRHMNVGPDTFFEISKGDSVRAPHTYSSTFANVLDIIKHGYLSLSITILILIASGNVNLLRQKVKSISPLTVLFVFIFIAYLCLLAVSHITFDRYYLPLLALMIFSLCVITQRYKPAYGWSVIPLVAVAYVSVAGTHDYFRTNEKRWQAYRDAVNVYKAATERVNGGFEVTAWNEGKPSRWDKYIFLHDMDYLIQYNAEDSFSVVKYYPYQRLFPVRKDTLRLSKRRVFAKSLQNN